MFSIFFIRGASGSTKFKTEICCILVIRILSGRFSLYITGSRIFTILKGPNFVKSSLSLSFVI